MKINSLLGLTSVPFLLIVKAIAEPILSVRTDAPKVVSFKFEKVNNNPLNIPDRSRERHRKRAQKTVVQLLDNADYLYYANVSIGTPPQNLRLHIDTGSSDIWVQSSESSFCQDPSNPCQETGIYNRKISSTYKFISSDFQITYADKEYSVGDYGKETFHVGSVAVTGLQFGIGLNTTSSQGIMGIGYSTNEVQVDWLGKKPYPNLVDLMVQQGYIQSRAYSLYLNDLGASTGEILFGGIDTAKYQGKLHTVPINIRFGKTQPQEFMVTLTSLGLTNNKGQSMTLTSSSFKIPVLLDSGTTYTYLPQSVWDKIAAEAAIEYKSRAAIAPCGLRDYNGTVSFGFSGFSINVPFNELVIDAYDIYGDRITYETGEPVCFFGIFPADASSDTYVLGDTFLRSAYVVYDLDNAEISMGNINFNASGSNILEIGTGKRSVPDATGVSNPVTVQYTSPGNFRPTAPFTQSTLPLPTVTAKSIASLITPVSGTLVASWILLWSLLV